MQRSLGMLRKISKIKSQFTLSYSHSFPIQSVHIFKLEEYLKSVVSNSFLKSYSE